jgi:hypothetical protein
MADCMLVYLEGLLNEKAGFDFLAKRGRVVDAQHCFRRAMDVYRDEWGSIAKYLWLRERSADALAELEANALLERTFYGQKKAVLKSLDTIPSSRE